MYESQVAYVRKIVSHSRACLAPWTPRVHCALRTPLSTGLRGPPGCTEDPQPHLGPPRSSLQVSKALPAFQAQQDAPLESPGSSGPTSPPSRSA